MYDLAVLIPARNEMFLAKTVENVLANMRGHTEIIAVLDGYMPDPPVVDHERVTLMHYAQPIGQRAATNVAARCTDARYVMKLDGHCAVDEGFDVKLVRAGDALGRTVTQIPRMYNLHAFDWVCRACGHRTYQGRTPTSCDRCHKAQGFTRDIVWKPRRHKRTDFARFDANLHFQYWLKNKETGESAYEDRPQVKAEGDIADTMTSIGACFVMARDRFFELGGLDEAHGSWGQFGVEIALKSWLSGGRHVVNKKTWFAHMFRTQGGDFGFPYEISGSDQEKARSYSQNLWLKDAWPLATRKLQWVLDKFAPVPGWHTKDMPRVNSTDGESDDASASSVRPPALVRPAMPKPPAMPRRPSVGLVYYSDGRPERVVLEAVQQQILRAAPGRLIVSSTLVPMDFGVNLHMRAERGILTMFKQILAGLEAQTADVIFLVEHDVLYHPSHFEFLPARSDCFYYNQNVWKVDRQTGKALHYRCSQTSGLCASRHVLIEHYRARVRRVEQEGFTRRMGFEPGTHSFPRGVDNYGHEVWMSTAPNVDIRHEKCLTPSRWSKDQFRNQKYTAGWTESDGVPGWGQTKGRMDEWLVALAQRAQVPV